MCFIRVLIEREDSSEVAVNLAYAKLAEDFCPTL
jgi:hypothetical protein